MGWKRPVDLGNSAPHAFHNTLKRIHPFCIHELFFPTTASTDLVSADASNSLYLIPPHARDSPYLPPVSNPPAEASKVWEGSAGSNCSDCHGDGCAV